LALSHASTKQKISEEILSELEKAADERVIEEGVYKFIEWLRFGKLEIKRIHPKIFTRRSTS
jgi:hypothetical protein